MKKRVLLAGSLCLLLGASTVWADSTVDMVVKFGGFSGKGAYEGPLLSMIKGEMKAEKSEQKFTGAVLSWFGGSSSDYTITRLDKEVVWKMDPKNKTYTETGILKFRPQAAQPENDKAVKEEPKAREEKPRYRTIRSENKVTRTGAKETINSFACEQYIITMLNEEEDLETKARTLTVWTFDLWNTPETPAIKNLQKDELAFTRAYLKKMNWDISAENFMRFGKGMLFGSASPEQMKYMDKDTRKFQKDLAGIKGYSIRTTVSLKSTETRPEAAKTAQPAQPAQEEEPSSSGLGWGSFLGDLQNSVTKSATQAATDTAKEKMKGDPNTPDLSFTSEIKSIKSDPLTGAEFEVPAGYTLQGKP
jgi:hypothetical protein